jgi:PIN domain nuclease of toxin-antitoxin system
VEAQLKDASSEIWVSAATIWEIAIKAASGKLGGIDELDRALRHYHFRPLSITPEHGKLAGSLPPHHKDPFDRMLVAQARIEGLTLVTRDARLTRYELPVLLA